MNETNDMNKRQAESGYSGRRRGQNLLEFALVLPVMIMVVFGVLDLGRIYFSVITITNAAREGARYLTRFPGDKKNGFNGTEMAVLREAEASFIPIDISNIETPIVCVDKKVKGEIDNVCDSGYSVIITVNYDFHLTLGFVLPSPIHLSRSAEMIVP